jgi:hypothetical protein
MAGAGLTQDGQTWRSAGGATLAYWHDAIAQVEAIPPKVLTLALSGNDSSMGSGGWTDSDEAEWTWALNNADPSTCIVIIGPAFGEAVEAVLPGTIEQARLAQAWLAGITRPNTFVLDWWAVMDQHPEWWLSDGVHLTGGDSLAARYAFMQTGWAQCPQEEGGDPTPL